MVAAVRQLSVTAEEYLSGAAALQSGVPAEAVPALLPAVAASQHLEQLRGAGYNIFAPELGRRCVQVF